MADRGESERDQFTALYDEHYAAVLRYAARRVGAEAAETFLTAWRRLDSVPATGPLAPARSSVGGTPRNTAVHSPGRLPGQRLRGGAVRTYTVGYVPGFDQG